jgi:capsular polysaccharide biosynthesis protein/Mrp family chromosome partitioning ATPase
MAAMIDKQLAPASMQTSDESLDVRRYLDALRRNSLFIIVLTLVATVGAVVSSSALPDQYRSTVRLVLEEPGNPLGTSNTEAIQRELSTTESLLTTRRVLDRAVAEVGGISREQLEDRVSSQVNDESNIIDVIAVDGDPARAAAIANGVAEAFITERTTLERDKLERARASLLAEIRAVQGSPNSDVQIRAIRDRISELSVALASAGSELQIAERAEPSSAPASPRPFRNGILACVAALFVGVLFALGRDLLVPRVAGARELSRLTRLTVLAGVPYVRTGFGRRSRYTSAAEDEAYQTLRAWVELELPSEGTRVLLVTSAVSSEAKTTATARLGQALVEAGYGVLLVSGDLRRPTLHELFGIEPRTGVADIIEQLAERADADTPSLIEQHAQQVSPATGGPRGQGELSLLTSGARPEDAVRSLTTDTARALFAGLRQVGFDYVLVDGPPLLGIADATVLAQEADDLLILARLDRVTVENAVDLREMLSRLSTPALGLVVIGTPSETSPYYLPRRPQAQAQQPPVARP